MTTTPDAASPTPAGDSDKKPPTFLEWLPWEKITIWGLFILAVYILRHFFFVIFMTFIVSYTMRALVVRVHSIISPHRERLWLERVLAVAGFIALFAALYGVWLYFAPKIRNQGEELVRKLASVRESPREKYDEILRDTVGRWLFYQKYGTPNDERYREAFEKYQSRKLHFSEYENFGKKARELTRDFDEHLSEQMAAEEFRRIESQGEKNTQFLEWLTTVKAPDLFRRDPSPYIDAWKKEHEALRAEHPLIVRPLEDLEKEPDFEERRDLLVIGSIVASMERDSVKLRNLEDEWKAWLGSQAAAELKQDNEELYTVRFRAYYEQLRDSDPSRIAQGPLGQPFEFSQFVALREAHAQGDVAFSRAWNNLLERAPDTEVASDPETEQEGFELRERTELLRTWREEDELAKDLQNLVEDKIGSGLAVVVDRVGDIVPRVLLLIVQLALSLLLSFLITLDVPKLKKGIGRLKESRVKNFYEEIAPGLISFGRLIGRAFQAQGLIAICNTILTFVAIWLLDIQNEAFLCAIVFICSFIPVLGVVLSSVPIAVMALIQDGGGVEKALYAIGAILVIHFIETSLLNPKILGDMMHLHPVLVLAILAVGEHFFGIWGLLLGVPVMVYIIRFVLLDEGIPGIIEPVRAGEHTGGARGISPPRGPPKGEAARAVGPRTTPAARS